MLFSNCIQYIHVGADSREYCDGFVTVYKQAFGGPPYNEVYTDEEVRGDAWLPHLQNGVVALAMSAKKVVGFGCALPVKYASEDIQAYLVGARNSGASIPEISDMWYFSELGVLNNHRRKGIGTRLIGQILAKILLIGDSYYVMRTAATGSNSRRIFESIGSDVIPGVQDVSETGQVQINKSQSTERMYLYGRCAHGLAKIFLRQ